MFQMGQVETMSLAQLRDERQACQTYMINLTWLLDQLQTLDQVIDDLKPYYPNDPVATTFGVQIRGVYAKSSAIQLHIMQRYAMVKDHLAQCEYFIEEALSATDVELGADDSETVIPLG